MLHRVWKGVVGDDHMYYSSSSDGLTWTDQRQIRGRTSHGPALIVLNYRLHRAWKGADTSSIYHSSSPDGLTWTDPQQIRGDTNRGPALVAWNNTLYLAWKASTSTSMFMSSLSSDGRWLPLPHPAIAGSTSHTPALSVGAGLYSDYLYCLWKGADTDTRMFLAAGSSEDDWLLQPGHEWRVVGLGDEWEVVGRTSHGPALCPLGGRLYCLWKGEGSDSRTFISYSTNGQKWSWSPPQQVSGQTSHGPALATGPGGKFYRLWKNPDNAIMISIGTFGLFGIEWGVKWTAEQQIVGLTSNTPSLVNLGR
jgi:hypothetical protein